MKFNTCYSYEPRVHKTVKKGSMAIPGQAYSIPKLVERMRQGLPIQVLKSGFNPDGFPKFDDLTTLDQFKKAVLEKQQRVEEKIKAIKDKKEAQERSDKAD